VPFLAAKEGFLDTLVINMKYRRKGVEIWIDFEKISHPANTPFGWNLL
jgi:hypothetical protein